MTKKNEQILNIIKSNYDYLITKFNYKIIDEYSSALICYVRFENKEFQRIISTGIDVRENDFGITIWKSKDGWTEDKNMLSFEFFLDKKGLEVKLKKLSGIEYNLDKIEKILNYNSQIFRKYGKRLILGVEE